MKPSTFNAQVHLDLWAWPSYIALSHWIAGFLSWGAGTVWLCFTWWHVGEVVLPLCAVEYLNHGRTHVSFRKRPWNLGQSFVSGTVAKCIVDRYYSSSFWWVSLVIQWGWCCSGWMRRDRLVETGFTRILLSSSIFYCNIRMSQIG